MASSCASLDLKKIFFSERVAVCWNRLHREVAVSLSLEVYKKKVYVILRDVVYWGNTGGRWMVGPSIGLGDLGGFFQPLILCLFFFPPHKSPYSSSGTSASSSLRLPTAQSPVSSENNEKLRSKQLYQYFINDHHNIKKNL